MNDYPRTLAVIEAHDPPDDVLTLADWMAWREAENERMRREVLAQVEAHLDRAFGGTVH